MNEVLEREQGIDDSIVNIASDRRAMLESARAAVGRLLDGAVMSPDFAVLFEAVSWDKRRLEKEIARERTRRELVAAAGSNAEFAVAQKTLAQLVEQTPKTVAEIDQQLSALQEERAGVERKLRDQQRRVEMMNASRKFLRGCVPEHVKSAHLFESQHLNKLHGPNMGALDSRLGMIRRLLGDIEKGKMTREQIILHCQGSLRDALKVTDEGQYIRTEIIDAKWRAYVDGLRAELPELETQAAELRAEIDRLQAEIDARHLDCFLED